MENEKKQLLDPKIRLPSSVNYGLGKALKARSDLGGSWCKRCISCKEIFFSVNRGGEPCRVCDE